MSALFLLAGVEVLLLVLIKVHIWQNERLIREIRRCNDDLAAALWFFASQERFRRGELERHGAGTNRCGRSRRAELCPNLHTAQQLAAGSVRWL